MIKSETIIFPQRLNSKRRLKDIIKSASGVPERMHSVLFSCREDTEGPLQLMFNFQEGNETTSLAMAMPCPFTY